MALLKNISGEQICGLSDEDLRFMTFESNKRYAKELTTEFNQDLEKDNELSDLTENSWTIWEKLRKVLYLNLQSSNQTKQHVNLFKRFWRIFLCKRILCTFRRPILTILWYFLQQNKKERWWILRTSKTHLYQSFNPTLSDVILTGVWILLKAKSLKEPTKPSKEW